MVGTGYMNGLMILSKPDLLAGFRNFGDKRNVGLHEFAHLVDKSDGAIDGLPHVGLDRAAIGPWIELVRRKMEEMQRQMHEFVAFVNSNMTPESTPDEAISNALIPVRTRVPVPARPRRQR